MILKRFIPNHHGTRKMQNQLPLIYWLKRAYDYSWFGATCAADTFEQKPVIFFIYQLNKLILKIRKGTFHNLKFTQKLVSIAMKMPTVFKK